VFIGISVVSSIAFLALKWGIDDLFITGGLYISTQITLTAFSVIGIIFSAFGTSAYFTAKKGVFNEF
jgi:hypothetical protein